LFTIFKIKKIKKKKNPKIHSSFNKSNLKYSNENVGQELRERHSDWRQIDLLIWLDLLHWGWGLKVFSLFRFERVICFFSLTRSSSKFYLTKPSPRRCQSLKYTITSEVQSYSLLLKSIEAHTQSTHLDDQIEIWQKFMVVIYNLVFILKLIILNYDIMLC
jgi:hypothetical protein